MKYNEMVAIKRLARNGVKVRSTTITLGVDQMVGIKLWGAIDYLCNHCNFVWVRKERKS